MILYRPVGQRELDLIAASGWREFPPRLPHQPVFYPVCNVEYAILIARDWNARDEGSGHVVRFEIEENFIARYERKIVGARIHEEYWIPAEDLEDLNANLRGLIESVVSF